MRTLDRVLALFLGETKHYVAARALAVDVGLTVAEFILLQFEKTGKFIPNFQKSAILRLSAVKIFGEGAEKVEHEEDQLNARQNDAPEKYIDDKQGKISPK